MKNFKTWYFGWVLGIVITVLMYEFVFPNSSYMNKLPDPNEIKVGSIVVLGENGTMEYINPEDLYTIEGDSIRILKSGCYEFTGNGNKMTVTNFQPDSTCTIKGEVRGINTKDINPAPPMHSIGIIKRIVSGDSVRYYVPNVFK